MGKQTVADVLRRWMDLDLHLAREGQGMDLSEFARKWGVDPKTIRRDLKAFRDLGYQMREQQYESGPENIVWEYVPGQRPMFVQTVRTLYRPTVKKPRPADC